jgi:hydrogenase-4 component B
MPEPVPEQEPAPEPEPEPELKQPSEPTQEPEAEPASVCDPPTPYRFAPAGIQGPALELTRCDANAEPLDAPEVSRALVERVQQALRFRGYQPGPADGLLGPRTRAAIRELLQDNGQESDGNISFALLDLLQIGANTED